MAPVSVSKAPIVGLRWRSSRRLVIRLIFTGG
jgi:hypothetical protein